MENMANFSALEQLAQLHHIEVNAEGGDKPSAATLVSILQAMGVACDSPQAIEESLHQAEQAPWRASICPTLVVRVSADEPAIDVHLPQRLGQQELTYTIQWENGDSESVQPISWDDLAELENREIDAEIYSKRRVPLVGLVEGYHQLSIVADGTAVAKALLIVVPEQCFQPDAIVGQRRIWGVDTQIERLRSRHSWGIGDYSDLIRLVDSAAALGADSVGLSSLHAQQWLGNDGQHSLPSSCNFLHLAYLDVGAIDEFNQSESAQQLWHDADFQHCLSRLRASEQVDWHGVIAIKLQVLEQLYQHFQTQHIERNSYRARQFHDFRAAGGHSLWQFCVFTTLQEHLMRQKPEYSDWRHWPEEFQSPESAAVDAFAREHEERITFYLYLQWQCDAQLNEVGLRCLTLNRGVGLYHNLPLTPEPSGADAWRYQQIFAREGVSSPAPVAHFATDSGMHGSAMLPRGLKQTGYAHFIESLRINMRHIGALRLSQIGQLFRQYWVVDDTEQGAYVSYDAEDFMGILALESRRNQCLVVGENIGWLASDISDTLHQRGILTEQVLYCEKIDDYTFRAPEDYPHHSIATVTNHQLPTLKAFWKGEDLERQDELDLFSSPEARQREITLRAADRAALLLALEKQQLLPDGMLPDPAQIPEMTNALAIAIHHFLALAPSRMFMVQLENLIESPDAHWSEQSESILSSSERFYTELEDLLEQPLVWQIADMLHTTHRAQPLVSARQAAAPLSLDAVPLASYRFQLTPDFDFYAATEQIDYLKQLGISHLYCSPILAARKGSMHGYDVTDHGQLNPELGGQDGFEHLSEAIKKAGMRTIVDIVPNHMVVMGHDNTWWNDVLENGPASIYADHFDIDWTPVKRELQAKVLVPALGGPYGAILQNGELQLKFDEAHGSFGVWYYDHLFPIDPSTYPDILALRLDELTAQLGNTDRQLAELKSLIATFEHLPHRHQLDEASMEERNRDKDIHKTRLARLCVEADAIKSFIQANVSMINEGDTAEYLHPLLEKQAYRLAYWRTAAEEINYRRFFDINELAGIRMENPAVLEETHRLIFDLIEQKKVHGLRVDHADGLNDPAGYFNALSRRLSSPLRKRQVYLVAEKIIAPYESLPSDWEVDGSTGYEALSVINGLFVAGDNEQRFSDIYQKFIDQKVDFEALVHRNKQRIMQSALASELNVLANRLNQIAEVSPMTRDFTLNSLRDALMEVTACFPVYRTYIAFDAMSETDEHYIDWAVAQAKKNSTLVDLSVFDFVHDVLLLKLPPYASDELRWHQTLSNFVMSFQQFTSPVMAKGVEDTSFYDFNRLVSLNEVGSEPSRFGNSVSAFHHINKQRGHHWPYNMLCLTTHDTKRSEDTRARINVLSEMPDEWEEHVNRWHRINNRLIIEDENGQAAPSLNDEYLLYQTLVGSWPFEGFADDEACQVYVERIQGYMIKAAREAKVHTSWLNTNETYETALTQFAAEVIAGQNNTLFMDDFLPFQRKVAEFGVYNSLAQTLLKLTVPGAPDIYQGTELWDFSLVDPDNRRPVDYALRRRMLAHIDEFLVDGAASDLVQQLLSDYVSGEVKLYSMWRMLQTRRQHHELFSEGDYQGLETKGAMADQLCVFSRTYEEQVMVVITPCMLANHLTCDKPPVGSFWQDSEVVLPEKLQGLTWREVFTEKELAIEGSMAMTDVLEHFPVAVLLAEVKG
ncbi:MAG: 4-alpha-glucanotransferase [Kangiellaceae bacterium]|nr:4-alpha-glucanotransferase [Kangiellaceae bacterium]|tara:strand:+ start:1244 stop:6328 length:5085 start_codon:yes stop_codon:yes gene_type:complete